MGRFDEDTTLVADGAGRFEGRVSERWYVGRGANGGLIAAQAVRAMELLAADAERLPLSLTIHFLEAPTAGRIDIAGSVERAGRSTTAIQLRFEQEGRTVALVLGALARWRPGSREHHGSVAPAVPEPEALAPLGPALDNPPAFFENYDWRLAPGAAGEARVSGWIRTRDPRPVDHLSLAAFADAFPPAVFVIAQPGAAAPTIDLTVHFRAPLQAVRATTDRDWVLGRFQSRRVAGGFFEEDGELWSPDGTLLVQSRQLGVLREPAA